MPVLARMHRSKLRPVLCCIAIIVSLFLALVGLRALFPLDYRDDILKWSDIYNLDPAWVAAVIRCESNYQRSAISTAGAVGLMQIMPATGAWIAEQLEWPNVSNLDLQDESTNIAMGTWYLRYLLDRFGDPDVALMAYNAGPTNAERWNGSLEEAFPETQQYVRRVRYCLPIYRFYSMVPWLLHLIPAR